MQKTLDRWKTALGLAALPALGLGAFGYGHTVVTCVLISSWLTAWAALSLD